MMGRLAKKRIKAAALYCILILISILILAPLMIMVLGSFKDSVEVTAFDLKLPSKWHFDNYLTVLNGGFIKATLNSLFITVTSVTATVFCSSLASFILARRKTRVSSFLYYFFFMGSLIPMQIVPTIQIFKVLGIYGTYMNAIIIYTVLNLSFSCFLYVGFIKTVPQTIDEAAFIDGANVFQVYLRIVFPLLKSVNITVMIITFMNIWNDINIPLYFLSNPEKWTVPMSVYNYFGKYSGNHWELVFADLSLTALPVIILYIFAQKYIVSGLTAGSVKQ